MYVCICNAIKESVLRDMATRMPGDAETIYAALGKRVQCGQCLDQATQILIEERTRPLLACDHTDQGA